MKRSRFWTLLSFVITVTLVVLIAMDQWLAGSDALSVFTAVCVAIFVAFNVFAFLAGTSAARSTSPYRFVQLVMGLMILKMVVCVAIVVIYVESVRPDSEMFIVPFLFIYLIFTIFEVYALLQVSRLRPPRQDAG